MIKTIEKTVKKTIDSFFPYNPNSTRADIVNICFACGEKEIELGLTCTLEDIEREFNIGKYKIKTRC